MTEQHILQHLLRFKALLLPLLAALLLACSLVPGALHLGSTSLRKALRPGQQQHKHLCCQPRSYVLI